MSGILSYALKLETAGFTSPLAEARSRLGDLQTAAIGSGGGLAGLAGAAGVAGAAVITLGTALKGAQAALAGYAEFDGLVRGLKTLEGTAAATTARLEKMREVAKMPGLGFEEAIRGDIKLRAVGLSADLSEKALRAFGNALATVGGGKDDLNGVILGLTQIAAKGKISAEEINQIAERVPQVRAAMKAAFGTADTEALGKSGMTAVEFITRLTDQLAKLPAITGGARNALDNYADSWKALKVSASEFVESASRGLLDDMSKAFNQTRKSLEELKKWMGIKTPGLEGKDGETEAARSATAAAAAKTAAATAAATDQRNLEDANFAFWADLAAKQAAIHQADAARALALETSNAAKIKASQESIFAARLTKEADLQRRIADLQQGRHGADQVNMIAPNSNLQAEVAQRTATIVSLQKELTDLQQDTAKATAASAEAAARQAEQLAAAGAAAAELATAAQAAARNWNAENAILIARGGHHAKLATALERELKLEELKLKLMKEQGLSAEDATKKANTRLALEDRAAGKGSGGPLARAAAAAAKAETTQRDRAKRLEDPFLPRSARLAMEAAQRRADRDRDRNPLNPKDAAAALARGGASADPAHVRRAAAAAAAAAERAKADDPIVGLVKSIAAKFDKLAAA